MSMLRNTPDYWAKARQENNTLNITKPKHMHKGGGHEEGGLSNRAKCAASERSRAERASFASERSTSRGLRVLLPRAPASLQHTTHNRRARTRTHTHNHNTQHTREAASQPGATQPASLPVLAGPARPMPAELGPRGGGGLRVEPKGRNS